MAKYLEFFGWRWLSIFVVSGVTALLWWLFLHDVFPKLEYLDYVEIWLAVYIGTMSIEAMDITWKLLNEKYAPRR